jgi:DNA polymerase III delta subunit
VQRKGRECAINQFVEKGRYFLIGGNDLYQSQRALAAITARFRKVDANLTDLARFDLAENSMDTLKRALLTVPFLVTHRLFILTHVFQSPKGTLHELTALFEKMAHSTVVVIYETKPCDKRLGLYTWLTKHGTVQEYTIPPQGGLQTFIARVGRENNMVIDQAAGEMLANLFPGDTLQLVSEIEKLVNFTRAQSKSHITPRAVLEMWAVSLGQQLMRQHDPMLLAATLASQIRTYAKLKLCEKEGVTYTSAIAKRTALNPYVVKLALPVMRHVSLETIQNCYRELIRFDQRVKSGMVEAQLGFILLVVRLHVTLKRRQD